MAGKQAVSASSERSASTRAFSFVEIQVDGWTALKAVMTEEQEVQGYERDVDVDYILFPEDLIDKGMRLL